VIELDFAIGNPLCACTLVSRCRNVPILAPFFFTGYLRRRRHAAPESGDPWSPTYGSQPIAFDLLGLYLRDRSFCASLIPRLITQGSYRNLMSSRIDPPNPQAILHDKIATEEQKVT